MKNLDAKILKESIEEVVEKKLLTEEVKLIFFGEISYAAVRGDISLQEAEEFEKMIQFDRAKHKDAVDITLMGERMP